MAKAVITVVGRRKLCKAHAGDLELPEIVSMVLGDGGLNQEGNVKAPTGEETALGNQLIVKNIEKHSYATDDETTCRYTASLEKDELVGKRISEQGLIDAAGDLVAYKTFSVKEKDDDMKFIFDMDEIF